MKSFLCPACSARLKIQDSLASKPLTCPKCRERFYLAGKSLVPAIYRKLDFGGPASGPEPDWIDAEFEELPPRERIEKDWRQETSSPGEFGKEEPFSGLVPADDYSPSGWEYDQGSRNRTGLLVALIVGLIMTVAGGGIYFASKAGKHPEKLAFNDPPPKQGQVISLEKPRTNSEPIRARPAPNRQPVQNSGREGYRPPFNPYNSILPPLKETAPPLVPAASAEKEPVKDAPKKPTIPASEIEQDHKTILQYAKTTMSQTGLKELQWKGPWLARAAASSKQGKLYRLRATKRDVGTDFKMHDAAFGMYFFIFDDAVLRHERDPGELDKVKICVVEDPEVLIPPERPAKEKPVDDARTKTSTPSGRKGRSLPKQSNEGDVRYLSDMEAFDVHVAEGRFGQHGELGFRAGNPLRGRILFNGKESPNGISMQPYQEGHASAKFTLQDDSKTFKARVALNDSAGTSGAPQGVGRINHPISFEVVGDGKVLWKSKDVDIARKAQDCTVDVAGVRVLELRVNSPGDWVNCHAVWLEPRVLLNSQ
jgi:hypothetical protein